jgi:anti-anti-sigma factor
VDELTYSSSFDEASAVLTVRGEVDEAAALALRDTLTECTRGFERSIRVDVSAVDYLPSVAVGVIATARRRAEQAGVRLGLVAAEGTVAQRVLTVCALDHEPA